MMKSRNRQPAFTARLKPLVVEKTFGELSREEYLRRYPASNYEAYIATQKMIEGYYSRSTAEISKDLRRQHDEDKARGFSTD